MKRKYIGTILVCIFIVACAMGCGEEKALQVGFIDTDQLMMEWDKYKDFGQDYIKERQELMNTLPKDPKDVTLADRKKILDNQQKWQEVKDKLRDEIRGASLVVAREQKLDMIIDNSETMPVVEYGGTDVTVDVLKVLNEKKEE